MTFRLTMSSSKIFRRLFHFSLAFSFPPPIGMSLCFQDAYNQRRQKIISNGLYFQYLVAHFKGVRHPDDSGYDSFLQDVDPFGSSVRQSALSSTYRPLTDIEASAIQELFHHCDTGDSELLKTTYQQIHEQHPTVNLIQPITVLATVKQHLNIIRYGLTHGAVFDKDMDSAIKLSEYDSTGLRIWTYDWSIPFLNLLYEYNWKNIKTSRDALSKLAEPKFSIQALQWFIDHGARLGNHFTQNCRYESVSKIKFAIEQSGFEVFRGTGVINFAAIDGRIDIIELLLNAGICVLDSDTIVDVREPGPSTVLMEAVINNHFEIAKLAIERGSPISELSRKYAKAQGGEMAELIEKYANATDREVHVCTMETCGRLSAWNRKRT